jgi:chromosome segregation ATPase
MHRYCLIVLGFLLIAGRGFAQSTSTDTQGLQALVAEVRQLRKDLQSINGSALKAQILLSRLQDQEGAVARLSQHLEDVRSKLADTQDHRRQLVAVMKRNEELVDNTEISPASRKEAQEVISRVKPQLEMLAAEEQERQRREMESEEQLRTEQAKLAGLEDRLDRLEKDLGNNPQ